MYSDLKMLSICHALTLLIIFLYIDGHIDISNSWEWFRIRFSGWLQSVVLIAMISQLNVAGNFKRHALNDIRRDNENDDYRT